MAEHRLNFEGATLATEVAGEGPAVMLLHGFPFHRGMWDAQIEGLSDEFRVIAPDLRGFGRSTLAKKNVVDGIGMDQFAADAAAVLDELGVEEAVTLVGFSMGGYAAWQFALRYPERLRALVLVDTRAAADADAARDGRLKMAEAALVACDSAPVQVMLPKLLAAATIETRPDIVDRVRAFMEQATGEAIAAAQRGMARRQDVRGRLGEITCPALGIVGSADAISPPAEMHEIVAALPRARLVEIENAGHSTPLENPAAVTAAIREFVQSL